MSRKTETKTEKSISKALEILEANPDGVIHSDLIRRVHHALPEINMNTIRGSVWDIDIKYPEKVFKPVRGLFRHTKYKEQTETFHQEKLESKPAKVKEEDFYQPFADWLVKEMEECTKAISLGGNKFGSKWGTPDVIGIREPRRGDIIKSNTDVFSAEIKTDSNNLITAFGQACSYKLFSHKAYIVVPKQSSKEDIERIDALCLIFGIGLVLFDSSNPQEPDFEIRVRPSKHEPDMFYVNRCMKLIEDDLFS